MTHSEEIIRTWAAVAGAAAVAEGKAVVVDSNCTSSAVEEGVVGFSISNIVAAGVAQALPAVAGTAGGKRIARA